jgi:hypothetical protein
LTDRRYCYPLTITDYASRYLFAVEALQSTKEVTAFTVSEQVLRKSCMPKHIGTCDLPGRYGTRQEELFCRRAFAGPYPSAICLSNTEP